jgi:uncharacterized protein YjbJ (UPF0337 family)
VTKEQIKSNWSQLQERVRAQWGKLTNDDLDEIAGNRKLLAGKIQQQYGLTAEEAEQQVNNWKYVNKQPINWDKIQHNWGQCRGMIKRHWNKLTNDDLDIIQGNPTILEMRLQERYGIAQEEARKQIQQWEYAT